MIDVPAKCNAAMWHDYHQLHKPSALYEVDDYVILFQFLTYVRCLKYSHHTYVCCNLSGIDSKYVLKLQVN
jgi:hypothetical protein